MPTPKKRLNVMQFITPVGYYGAERWVVALARNIDETQVRCHLVLPTGHDTDVDELVENYPTEKGDIYRIETSGRFDWSFIGKLADLMRERNIDLLHTHGYKSDILGVLAARRAGVRCISTPHGFGQELGLKLKVFVKASMIALKFHDMVVPLSPDLLRDMKQRGISEKKLRYIPNGVDTTEIDSFRSSSVVDEASSLGIDADNCFNIGYVGRLAEGKGLGELVQIFDLVWQKNNRSHLYLVGDGPLRDQLVQQVESLDCKGNVTFTGFQNDRFRYLRQFDVFVMTSVSEGIPRSMMEAMMFEVAIAAYDIPGVDELVTHGQTGMLAPLGDQQTFAENLNTLISDSELRDRMASAGRTHVEQTHSGLSMARSYTELYHELCG